MSAPAGPAARPGAAAEREVWLDVLRVAATFAVVILHVGAQNWYDTDIRTSAWNAFNFYESVVHWCVPVFVMISGALMLEGERPLRKLYGKNILRLVTAFCFWSLIYAAVDVGRGAGLRRAAASFVQGHYHLWYLYMIAGVYMLLPLLKKIAEHEKLTDYFLALSFLFAFLLPSAAMIGTEYRWKGANVLWTVMDYGQVHFVLGYTSYFLLGWRLRQKDLGCAASRTILVLGLLSFPATVALSVAVSRFTDMPNETFYGDFMVNVLLESVFLFLLCRDRFRNYPFRAKTRSFLGKLAQYSFGAYLIHALILEGLDSLFHVNTLSFSSWLAVPAISVLVFGVSFVLSAALNRIPVLNRYIV